MGTSSGQAPDGARSEITATLDKPKFEAIPFQPGDPVTVAWNEGDVHNVASAARSNPSRRWKDCDTDPRPTAKLTHRKLLQGAGALAGTSAGSGTMTGFRPCGLNETCTTGAGLLTSGLAAHLTEWSGAHR